jgi:hypothetical protein
MNGPLLPMKESSARTGKEVEPPSHYDSDGRYILPLPGTESWSSELKNCLSTVRDSRTRQTDRDIGVHTRVSLPFKE